VACNLYVGVARHPKRAVWTVVPDGPVWDFELVACRRDAEVMAVAAAAALEEAHRARTEAGGD